MSRPRNSGRGLPVGGQGSITNVEISFSLVLPRDASSVPAVRHLMGTTMASLGVHEECIHEVQLAVTEACTNVLKHATGAGDRYQVEVHINGETAAITVTDKGHGFDYRALSGDIEPTEESGRGILLMRALVDSVEFRSEPRAGTVVNLTKRLRLLDGSLLRRLSDAIHGRFEVAAERAPST